MPATIKISSKLAVVFFQWQRLWLHWIVTTVNIQSISRKQMQTIRCIFMCIYMIYTHFSVTSTFLLTKHPQFTHQVLTNPPVSPKPFRGAAAAFRAFGRKLPQNSTWSGQNGLLAKKKKSLFVGTTCKGCRFVKVGWFWDWWFVEGDLGWGMNDRWFLDMSQSSKARKLYKQMPGRMIFEWMLTGRSWWVQPRFGWFCLGWLFSRDFLCSDGCKAWDLKKMFTTLLRAWWGRIHA